ncbi:hypothetical protein PI125_g21971 [Phytophthora idaei]|nr:hypothetical protein PI125_g21971 [Phytophthora idaei]
MDSSKKTVLITGSTRGIGLAFAEQYTKAGWNVIGTRRQQHGKVECAWPLEGQPIDLLINNAGIGLPGDFKSITKAALLRQFEVNTIGPFLVTRSLLPNLQLASTAHGVAHVVQLSSVVGSIGSITNETAAMFKDALYGYGSSKAALNMITRALAVELSANNIVVVSVHPGYVDTDMTQGKATLKPANSVAAMASFVSKLSSESTGKFFNLDPQIPAAELPW